jgi:hypothetical protein
VNKPTHCFLLRTVLLCFCIGISLLYATESYALSAYRIAYSKKHNLEVFADTLTDQWCESIVHLRVVIKDRTVLEKEEFSDILSKIVKVAVGKCSLVHEVDIKGYDVDNNQLYKATINVGGEWLITNEQFLTVEDASIDNESEEGRKTSSTNVINNDEIIKDLKTTSNNPTYRYFLVNGWMPQGYDAPVNIENSAYFEHDIYSLDGQCKIRLNAKNPPKEVKKWYLNVRKGACFDGKYLQGNADVQIMVGNGVVYGEGTGFFSDGFFTGDEHWNTTFLNRYAFGENNQRVNFLIDVDPALGIYYIGYLHSNYNAKLEKFSSWHGCNPFKINAVTENSKMFLDENKVKEMVDKAGYYADLFCPGKNEFSFFASSVPKGISNIDKPAKEFAWRNDDHFIYGAIIKKNSLTGGWEFKHELAANNEMLKIVAENSKKKRKQAIIASDHKILSTASFKEKLAYMHNVNTISDPKTLAVASLVSKSSVDAAIFVKIYKVGSGYAIADWPYKIYLDIPTNAKLTKGWYVVSGKFIANENTRKSKELGTVVVTRATKCRQDKCNEVNNATSLVNRRYELSDEEK